MFQIVTILILVICITFVVPILFKKLSDTRYRSVFWIMFGVYVVGYLYCTVFSREWGSGVTVEWRPFMSIVRLFDEPIEGGGKVVGLFARFMSGAAPITGIILNILLYYPLGYLLTILFPNLKPKHIILIGCLCSIATESTQYLLKMGWCETDDVIHNTFGGVIGVYIWRWQQQLIERQS